MTFWGNLMKSASNVATRNMLEFPQTVIQK